MNYDEIEEMTTILLEMSTDTYLECKYMILASARTRENAEVMKFFEKLFLLTDKYRPLSLEMKEVAA